jgi:hypothetical protein
MLMITLLASVRSRDWEGKTLIEAYVAVGIVAGLMMYAVARFESGAPAKGRLPDNVTWGRQCCISMCRPRDPRYLR